ncbi:TTI1 (YKL033W) [Zygosaccharomyces parabailii]|nr:TTI1 (YKL033W) [Zygosaccharomyces parabailii]
MTSQSVAFQELRPLCVELSRLAFLPPQSFDPRSLILLSSLKRLDSKLTTFPDESFSQNLAEYVFVPVTGLLKHSRLGESQTEYVLRLISQLLRLSWTQRGTFAKELAEQLLPLITYLISQGQENSTLNENSAEFRAAGCQALFRFFVSMREQCYKSDFFSSGNTKNLSSLGLCITILLDVLEGIPENPKIQLRCLDTLRILYQDIIGDAEILSFVLPGTISTFVKVLVAPGLTVNYKVMIRTLKCMEVMLQIVYNDISLHTRRNPFTDLNEMLMYQQKNPKWHTNERIEINMENASQHRSLSWLLGTSSQIERALENFIPKLLKRQHPEINDALVSLVSVLFDNCNNSLGNCEAVFVSTLVRIRQDPKSHLGDHIRTLKDLVKRYLFKLGDIISFQNEQELLSFSYAIGVLNQYDVYKDYSFIRDIATKIIDILESDLLQTYSKSQNKKILEQTSSVILVNNLEAEIATSGNEVAILPRISNELLKTLGQLIMSTGMFIANESRLELFLESLLSEQVCATPVRKSLSLWFSTWAIRGLYGEHRAEGHLTDFLDLDQDNERSFSPCYMILEYCNRFAQEITSAHEGRSMSPQEETAMSVVLSSIETVCSIMHTEFAPELIDCVYLVVENLASPSATARHFAQRCTLTISVELYHGSVRETILSNIDYLVDAISTRLNLGMTERVSTVFTVICRIAGYEIIETFQDVIETIFKMIDYYHGYSALCIQFFQLFEVIVLEMKKKFMDTDKPVSTLQNNHSVRRSYAPWGMTNLQQLFSVLDKPSSEEDQTEEEEPSNFQEYFDSKIQEVDSDDEETHGDEEMELQAADREEKWISPIPVSSYRILLQVFNYGDRLLTHPSKHLRVQILHVMELIIPLLSTQYDSLLPQVANVWDTVVSCTMDPDYTIVRPACRCLQMMVHHAGDFVTRRFFELWDCWCDRSLLLTEVRTTGEMKVASFQVCAPRKFPPVTQDALLALAELLLEGVAVTELLLPDSALKDILYCCLQILPAERIAQKSIILADVVWVLKNVELSPRIPGD